MNRSWKDQKENICLAIQQISNHYGGDDVEWLREYARDIIMRYKDDLTVAERCFNELREQLKFMPKQDKDVLHGT